MADAKRPAARSPQPAVGSATRGVESSVRRGATEEAEWGTEVRKPAARSPQSAVANIREASGFTHDVAEASRRADVRRRRAYLFVLILMGLFAHSVGGYVPFFLFAFTLCVYLGSAMWLVLGAQGIALTNDADFDERVMVGHDYPLLLTIKNISMVTWPWLTAVVGAAPGIELDQPQSHCGVVAPRASHRFRVQLRFTHRGRYERLWVRLTLQDLLGLFGQEWAVERRIDLTVLPRILPIEGQIEGSGYAMGVTDRVRQLSEDLAQPMGLRAYIHGDSIRRVHWKTTAKTGELMVKTYAHQSRTQIYLYLDCCASRQAGEGDDSSFERAVVMAASLASHFLARRVATGLVAAGAPAPLYPADDHLAQEALLLDALALVTPVPGDGAPERVAAELSAIPSGSVLVLISTMASEAMHELILRLQLRQIRVAVVQLDLTGYAVASSAESVSRSAGSIAPWVVVKSDDDLALVLGEVTYALLR